MDTCRGQRLLCADGRAHAGDNALPAREDSLSGLVKEDAQCTAAMARLFDGQATNSTAARKAQWSRGTR